MITKLSYTFSPNNHAPTTVGFMNPPYSNIYPFVWKALQIILFKRYDTIVCVLPVRTSTKWFKLFYDHSRQKPRFGCEIRYLPKRVKFIHPETQKEMGAPTFDTMIVVLRRGVNQDDN